MNFPIYLDGFPETQVAPSLKGQISKESPYITEYQTNLQDLLPQTLDI